MTLFGFQSITGVKHKKCCPKPQIPRSSYPSLSRRCRSPDLLQKSWPRNPDHPAGNVQRGDATSLSSRVMIIGKVYNASLKIGIFQNVSSNFMNLVHLSVRQKCHDNEASRISVDFVVFVSGNSYLKLINDFTQNRIRITMQTHNQ